MKVNRPALYVLAIIMAAASLYAWMENRSYEPKEKTYSTPNETETEKSSPKPPPKVVAEKKTPHFVAGRAGLVEAAKKVYAGKPEKTDEMPLASKLIVKPVSNNQSIRLPSVNVAFIDDLYACSQSECEKGNSVVTANGFYIYKGEAPKALNSKSKALVTYDKNMNQYGIWERRVIVETDAPVDLSAKLSDMKFESIERPQDKLFIAEYVGDVSNLDNVLNELKATSHVKDVRLEITYSRNKTN